MTLSEEARDRLADVVELQPTKNSELQDRWELDSGSDVHQYLESELSDYYYRDDNSLIRASSASRNCRPRSSRCWPASTGGPRA
jgi:hypothetical protein